MNYRTLGKSGFNISEISLGTWQVGGKWGSAFDHDNADKILHAAIDAGINFIDTADVYGEHPGESETAVGRVVRQRSEEILVATKCGRQLNPHVNASYTPEALTQYVEDSLRRMQLETIDLIQLHCPPTEVYYRPEIFECFERLKEAGKIRHLGVSVEKVEEALKAIEYPNVVSVQIIYNIFRQRPAALIFPLAKERNVGVIVRVPLASGLLTGLYDKKTTFDTGDHRFFNREGAMFDKGETFAGIPYEIGLQAVEKIKAIFPDQKNLAPIALKWVLMNENITTVIPGASRPEQVSSNLNALKVPEITAEEFSLLNQIYQTEIKPLVHHLW